MAIILNRPQVINALTTDMIRLIRQALDEARIRMTSLDGSLLLLAKCLP